MLTDAQCRGARAFLNWSREQLAEKAGISTRTLVDFERGARKPMRNNLLAIEAALQAAGVWLKDDGCICTHDPRTELESC